MAGLLHSIAVFGLVRGNSLRHFRNVECESGYCEVRLSKFYIFLSFLEKLLFSRNLKLKGNNVSNLSRLILESLLNCVYDSISTVLRKVVEKKALIDNMDTIILILDEVCDEG